MKYIEQHNMEAKKGWHTFTLGMNEYGDMVRKPSNPIITQS